MLCLVIRTQMPISFDPIRPQNTLNFQYQISSYPYHISIYPKSSRDGNICCVCLCALWQILKVKLLIRKIKLLSLIFYYSRINPESFSPLIIIRLLAGELFFQVLLP